jgi:alanyl-tRNA synthetase
LSGDAAFRLYDTYGFPLDLTEVICDERGVKVDVEGYDKALAEARARSEFVGRETAVEQVYREVLAKVPAGAVKFTGYEREKDEGKVVALLQKGKLVDSLESGADGEVVLDKTPFYGEAGGQIGDKGTLVTTSGTRLEVEDTQKPITGLTVQRAKVTSGRLAVGDVVVAEVDHTRRDATRRSHSATHLLHYALRRVLGEQAQQKGSLVEPDRLRFDFTSGRGMTAEERARVEDLVNEKVLVNAPVETEVLPIDEARKRGAMAIFEEKYGDIVRVLTMTDDSIELCGGTHARATGDIGLFKILSEGGVAAGVRRLEAVTGQKAIAYVRSLEQTVQRASAAVKASSGELVEKVEKLTQKERELEKQVSELTKKLAMGGSGGGGAEAMLARAREVGGIKVLGVGVEGADPSALREMAEQLRDKLGDSVVLVAAHRDGKVQLVLTVAKALTSRIRAGDLIRPLAQLVGGSGGGRPDMAQAGGTQVERFQEAVEGVYRVVGESLGA